jgi:hypothetical protein
MAWAIEQNVDSPSARCVLMSIANYANENWCAWPKQETIAREGVQSVDSVQRRMPNLLNSGLVRHSSRRLLRKSGRYCRSGATSLRITKLPQTAVATKIIQ